MEVFDLHESGADFRALVFDEGELGFKVAFYRLKGDAYSLTSVSYLGGYERPYLRGTAKPEIAARHHRFRLVWSFRYLDGGFQFEPDVETVENGIRYSAGESVEVDKVEFVRHVLGDEEFARELEQERQRDSGAGGDTAAGRQVEIAGQAVKRLPADASPDRDGFFLDDSRLASSPNYRKYLEQVRLRESTLRDAAGAEATTVLVQVHRDGKQVYAYAPCGKPEFTLVFSKDRRLFIRSWETEEYRLDDLHFDADAFTFKLSRDSLKQSRHPEWVPRRVKSSGRVVARNPPVYEVDLWGRFSFLAVHREDLPRLPLVINRCEAGKRHELAWEK